MIRSVLDASALLAFLCGEPGSQMVVDALPGSAISAVNLAETYAKLSKYCDSLETAAHHIDRLQIPAIPFDHSQALLAASIHASSRAHGLSLADCACLALGVSQNAVVVTADRKWSELALNVEIRLIR